MIAFHCFVLHEEKITDYRFVIDRFHLRFWSHVTEGRGGNLPVVNLQKSVWDGKSRGSNVNECGVSRYRINLHMYLLRLRGRCIHFARVFLLGRPIEI